MSFEGFISQGSTIKLPLQTLNTSSVPTAADAAPRFQVYNGTSGSRVDALAGQSSAAHTGSVTDATNASPIVITSASHGLETGARVTIASVGGNTAANGTFLVTKVSANTFSLDGSTGNGVYSGGGSFSVTGFYVISIDTTSLSSGTPYFVLSTWAISSSGRHQVLGFFVV